MTRRTGVRCAGLAVASALLAGCGPIPADPGGDLARIEESGTIRVGASPADGLVDTKGDAPAGELPEVVSEYAASIGADVAWTVDSEEGLVDRIEAGRLDLAIGGMTEESPWGERVGMTRGYPSLTAEGDSAPVVLLPMGANGLQASLETYLDGEVG